MSKPLSLKQKRFCEEYMIDLNATQAAMRAGYSPKTANEQGARLLAKVSVQKYLQEQAQTLSEKATLASESVLKRFGKIAFSDIRTYFDKNGKLKPIHELDDDAAAAIASIEVEELWVGNGKSRTQVGVVKKIRFFDKIRALEAINKMMGWNAAERVQHEVGESFLDLLKKTSVDSKTAATGSVNQQIPHSKTKSRNRQ
jgi:phage terminase small subunit